MSLLGTQCRGNCDHRVGGIFGRRNAGTNHFPLCETCLPQQLEVDLEYLARDEKEPGNNSDELEAAAAKYPLAVIHAELVKSMRQWQTQRRQTGADQRLRYLAGMLARADVDLLFRLINDYQNEKGFTNYYASVADELESGMSGSRNCRAALYLAEHMVDCLANIDPERLREYGDQFVRGLANLLEKRGSAYDRSAYLYIDLIGKMGTRAAEQTLHHIMVRNQDPQKCEKAAECLVENFEEGKEFLLSALNDAETPQQFNSAISVLLSVDDKRGEIQNFVLEQLIEQWEKEEGLLHDSQCIHNAMMSMWRYAHSPENSRARAQMLMGEILISSRSRPTQACQILETLGSFKDETTAAIILGFLRAIQKSQSLNEDSLRALVVCATRAVCRSYEQQLDEEGFDLFEQDVIKFIHKHWSRWHEVAADLARHHTRRTDDQYQQ